MAKEIKYDGSDKELLEIGLISEEGVVLDQNKYNLYMKEVAKREEYKNNQNLIKAGVVDESGRVLDNDKLREYQNKTLDKYLASRDYTEQKFDKANLFGRAIKKIQLRFGKKKMKAAQKDNSR